MLGFTIRFSSGVMEDMRRFRAHDRAAVVDAIDTHLAHLPMGESKKRTRLRNLVPPFDAVQPIWQLRVGAFRVFYDVNETQRCVYVRAVRKKPAHRTTEDIR